MIRGLVGVVLAGGLGRRIGGDKALQMLDGHPLLGHVLARVAPQLRATAINANGDASRFARWGLPVLPDTVPGHPGPLAGVLAGMLWARSCGAEMLLTVPVDVPFLPPDLAARLLAADGLACAASDGRAHPLAAVWPVALSADLAASLKCGERRVRDWTARHGIREVEFAVGEIDPFMNVNTPGDLARASRTR